MIPMAVAMGRQGRAGQGHKKKRKKYRGKGYTFRRQFSEKPNFMLDCPAGVSCAKAEPINLCAQAQQTRMLLLPQTHIQTEQHATAVSC